MSLMFVFVDADVVSIVTFLSLFVQRDKHIDCSF